MESYSKLTNILVNRHLILKQWPYEQTRHYVEYNGEQ